MGYSIWPSPQPKCCCPHFTDEKTEAKRFYVADTHDTVQKSQQ